MRAPNKLSHKTIRPHSGAEWNRWNRRLVAFVDEHQRPPGMAHGATVAVALELALHP